MTATGEYQFWMRDGGPNKRCSIAKACACIVIFTFTGHHRRWTRGRCVVRFQVLRKREYRKLNKIKIFVCNTPGKHSRLVDDSLYVPMLGGAALNKNNPNHLPGDDTGDNISVKNPTCCELTVQYWAWKNADADYYGFCHYRRYFDFAQHREEKDKFGNIIAEYLNDRSIRKYRLTGELPRRIIENSDIVVSDPVDVSKMPRAFLDIEDHFVNDSGFLRAEDLALMRQVVAQLAPEYLDTFNRYFAGKSGYFCNMFVARKEIFFRYCQWLFPLLEEFEKRADMSHYSAQSLRVTGHLAERLLGIFIQYQKQQNPGLKITEVPCVLFRHPEAMETMEPLGHPNTVPVVFAANNNFVGPLGVAVKSLLDHTSEGNFYDLVVLESDITAANKNRLRSLFTKPNAQIRFVNVLPLLDGYTLKAHAHISRETFFRFVIQDVMPGYDKILYLDSDLLIQSDVAELFSTDVKGCLLAAALDIDFASQINGYDRKMYAYARDTLQMADPYAYFQAGVLLLNLAEMRRAYTLDQWLTLASDDYKYSDQDVLNRYCQGRVKYLDQAWNLLFDNDFSRVSNVLCYAPKSLFDAYQEAAKAPKIVHFAGFAKPWLRSPTDHGDDFWQVARTTPFYEDLIYGMINHWGNEKIGLCMQDHNFRFHRSVSHWVGGIKHKCKGALRAAASLVMPRGSRRREQCKKFICRLTGREYIAPDYRIR